MSAKPDSQFCETCKKGFEKKSVDPEKVWGKDIGEISDFPQMISKI